MKIEGGEYGRRQYGVASRPTYPSSTRAAEEGNKVPRREEEFFLGRRAPSHFPHTRNTDDCRSAGGSGSIVLYVHYTQAVIGRLSRRFG